MFKRIKSFAILLVGLMILSIGQPVMANEGGSNIGVVNPMAYQYLFDCSSLYTLNGTSIGVSGTTQTYTNVSKITTTVYLEKKTSSGWSVVKSWTSSTNSSSYSSTSGSYIGIPGTTYRVRSLHIASNGGLTETNSSYTSSFTVD
ncbi:hypothetical protein [Desulforamulus reducens]|uniref:hypothetical protein n=1 Tax=Desulforamulus reducens TaxID=59610 RepID=UPI00059D15C5|nr:hypothetical protein [Desulforamulus reducens]